MAIILDPMLATGGSLIAAIDVLKKEGCRQICSLNLVAAPEGVKAVYKSDFTMVAVFMEGAEEAPAE